MFEITPEIKIPLSELQWTFVRSSGPGGQNVNKVASKAVLRWNVAASELLDTDSMARLAVSYPAHLTKEGELVITSQKTRDAIKNRTDCLEKLRAMLLTAIKKPKRRIPTHPTKGSIVRRLSNKARHAQKKQNRQKNLLISHLGES
ncbi:MAG: aminoacyl-tRNA hydrolase [Planctomycetaceae bacterium]|jgi:ribosome-associated protein|nr:aminoacyl-tRNA hydrolase [Planctomycetaceae bacterium]